MGKLFGPALGLRASDRTIERGDKNLKMKIAAVAILMCAVMVLVAGAPLVVADTHHVLKGAQGPRASARSWEYMPTESGIWNGHVENSGLRSLVVDVNDITTGAASSILHQRIRFAVAGNSMDTAGAIMAQNHKYNITVTPNGPKGTSCTVDDVYTALSPPVARFTYTVLDATVSVDGSTSSDPNVGGTIMGWGWEWGDGTTGTGVTASHTYTASKTYTIMLTVLSSTGMTGSTSHDVPVIVPVPVDQNPIARFTYTTSSLTLNVDGSTSTDDHPPISAWAWNWGDGSALGSGVSASHKYALKGTYTVTLTVTDSIGQTNALPKQVLIVDNPPVASFTQTNSSLTVNVVSISTDDYGIVSYDWNWGDGSAHGSSATATHTYAAPTSLASVSGQSIINVPGFPQYVVGTTYNSAGLALPNCQVTITDQRTGGAITGIVSDATGFYSYDINDPVAPIPGGWAIGDVLVVSATNANGASGSSTGLIDATPVSYIDVTLTGTLPVLVTVTITLTVTDTIGQTSTVSMTITLKK